MDRVNELIRQEVSRVVLTGLKDPRMSMVTITRAKVSRDLHFAKIFFTIMGTDDTKARLSKSLVAASGRVRRLVGANIRLRYIPQIMFMYDESFVAGERVFELMRELNRGQEQATLEIGESDDLNPDGQRISAEYEDVLDVFKNKKSFLLTTHVRPDGDAIGSIAALSRILSGENRRVCLILQDGVPEVYRFLTEGLEVYTTPPNGEMYDVAVLLDVATFNRSGVPGLHLHRASTIVNIDHHMGNELFGDVNLVVPEASSTGEILYEIFRRWDVDITDEIAGALYAAIMTDTGRFSYENTSPACLRIAAALVERGMDVTAISNRLYNDEALPRIRLIGSIITGMKVDLDLGIAWCSVTREILESNGATFEHTNDIISCIRTIHGVEIALLFKEVSSQVTNVNFRSKDYFDVNRFAQRFGGGGHRRAAGVTIKGPLQQVKDEVLGELRKILAAEEVTSP